MRGTLDGVVRAFDPELHLRLSGERAVLDTGQERLGPWGTTVDEVAAALVAIGALEEERALEIAHDYQVALGLRGRSPIPPFAFRRARPPVAGPAAGGALPAAPRVVACESTLELAGSHVHVHYVALSEDRTALAVSVPGSPMSPGQRRFGGLPGGGAPLQGVQLADDQGRRVGTHFGGSGSPQMWEGQLVADRPLSVATRWIDVGSERLVLGETAVPPPVEVEELTGASPAERYLRSRLTAGRHGPHGGPRPPMIDAAVETLVAAGALAPDSPVIAEVRDVLAAFSGQPGNALAEPWASLLAGISTQSDWDFVLPLGVVTPALSGSVVALDALLARDGVMQAHVRVGPGAVFAHGPWSRVATTPLAWWAADDLGNHYLGGTGSWSGGADGQSGTVVYWPSLHARARRLVLMPTAPDRRALVRLELPRRADR